VFRERTALAEQQLAEAQAHIAGLRQENERANADAARATAALTAESQQKAEQIVADAVARADRIRAESERELAAATQRRDSINAQLTNVRQMLATLSGTNPAAFGLGADDLEPTPAPAHQQNAQQQNAQQQNGAQQGATPDGPPAEQADDAEQAGNAGPPVALDKAKKG
jgi:chromosome segregation ATPase